MDRVNELKGRTRKIYLFSENKTSTSNLKEKNKNYSKNF